MKNGIKQVLVNMSCDEYDRIQEFSQWRKVNNLGKSMSEAIRELIRKIPENQLVRRKTPKIPSTDPREYVKKVRFGLSNHPEYQLIRLHLHEHEIIQIKLKFPELEFHEAAGKILDDWVSTYGDMLDWWDYVAALNPPGGWGNTTYERAYMKKTNRRKLHDYALLCMKQGKRPVYRPRTMDMLAREIFYFELNKEKLLKGESINE